MRRARTADGLLQDAHGTSCLAGNRYKPPPPSLYRRARRWLGGLRPSQLVALHTALQEQRAWDDLLKADAPAPPMFEEPLPWREGTVSEFCRMLEGTAAQATVGQADRAIDRTFDLLGSGPVRFSPSIEWDLDWKSGTRYRAALPPLLWRYHVRCDEGADIKVPWEIGRFAHLCALAQAYAITGDPRYSEEAACQVREFIDACPPPRGVQWACPMDIALRGVSWSWSYPLLTRSPGWDRDFLALFLKSCQSHGQYVMEHLDTRGNHLLADLCGLVFLGISLPDLAGACTWVDFGLTELCNQIGRQFHADGTNFEASVSYHRLSVELALYPLLAARARGIETPTEVWQQLERAIEFTLYYTKPDGQAPTVGDADDGRALILSEDTRQNKNDHRYLLSVGAAVFQRADFANAVEAFHPEALWLLGPTGHADFVTALGRGEPAALESRGFPDSGFYILRHGSDYMLIGAGGNGQEGRGGHAHNGLFSFDLFAGDRSLIIDPGTYCYTPDFAARNLFRSTAYHNTLMVDGQEINPIHYDQTFSLPDVARPKVIEWESNEDRDLLVVEHYGYCRLSPPVTHRRTFGFDKHRGQWAVEDELLGEGSHAWTLPFHYAPLIVTVPERTKTRVVAVVPNSDGWGLELRVTVMAPPETELCAHLEDGWVSPSYGVRHRAPVLVVRGRARLPLRLRTELIPLPSGAAG